MIHGLTHSSQSSPFGQCLTCRAVRWLSTARWNRCNEKPLLVQNLWSHQTIWKRPLLVILWYICMTVFPRRNARLAMFYFFDMLRMAMWLCGTVASLEIVWYSAWFVILTFSYFCNCRAGADPPVQDRVQWFPGFISWCCLLTCLLSFGLAGTDITIT
jgi:hypothetical protein